MSKNLAHPLHPVYDDGKGGGWEWWEWHFVLLNSHISAYLMCFAQKVCGLVRSTWGTSQGEDKPGARGRILKTKVARRACAGQTFPLWEELDLKEMEEADEEWGWGSHEE